MNFGGVDSFSFNDIKIRLITFFGFGKNDVRKFVEAAPYGVDSGVIKDMVCVYGETGVNGKRVVIGYINKNQLADIGEFRCYSTDKDGNLKTYVWLHNDGKINLGGNADNAVRYSKLDQALQTFKAQMQTELSAIQTGIISAGGTYTPGTLSIDISQSKITDILTP